MIIPFLLIVGNLVYIVYVYSKNIEIKMHTTIYFLILATILTLCFVILLLLKNDFLNKALLVTRSINNE
jgi:hypothetical protein